MKILAYILLIVGAIIALWVLIAGGYFTNVVAVPDIVKAKEIHPFMTGLVVPMLTLGSTLLVIENLRTTTRQNFSTNFLKLLDQHHKLVENISTNIEGVSDDPITNPSRARAFFDDMAYRIANDYYCCTDNSYIIENDCVLALDEDLEKEVKDKSGKELLVAIYDYYFHVHQSDMGHYFRNLYHIVTYADTASVSREIKKQHLQILRAQLSNYEILLLAYNGLHLYGAKFYPLIEKYNLLKSLNIETRLPVSRIKRIIDLKILIKAYPNFKKWLQEHDNLSEDFFI